MIEFLQTYGLWIALAGVFFAMHRFGMECCGGHKNRLARHAEGSADRRLKNDTQSDGAAKAGGNSN
jgi:hypothetical protein